MQDNRIRLNEDYILEVNGRIYSIKEEVGRGASCIVYNAVYSDSIGRFHKVRIKECYPVYLLIDRNLNGELTIQESMRDKFNRAKDNFKMSYERNVEIKNIVELTNSTINATDIVEDKNNTSYIIMSVDEGCDFARGTEESLRQLLIYIRSLVILIKKYHQLGYLHLDIKPENIFLLPETAEHILLFDFDTVIGISDIKNNARFQYSISEGYSSPEQMQGRVDKIGTHSDVFSIGAVLFYKLFERLVTINDCKIASKFNFTKMKFYNEKFPPKLYRELEKFLKKTLSTTVATRWNNMDDLLESLEELIELSDTSKVRLIHSLPSSIGNFVGRDEELQKIDEHLKNNQIVFVSGIGGIGKTEIVKQYLRRNQDKYDNIVFTVYQGDIKKLVCDEISINGVKVDKDENLDAYFVRKLDVLKDIVSPRDIIVIDNFDVENDDCLETLFECNCKFIVTSRGDYKGHTDSPIFVNQLDMQSLNKLFYGSNKLLYSKVEHKYIKKLVDYVDGHTMTVELIAKYLQDTGELPSELYEKFVVKGGITNVDDIHIRYKKDQCLRNENITTHLRILFDLSGFNDDEKAVLRYLSLFELIAINRKLFEELCQLRKQHNTITTLINRGWIHLDEVSQKIYLHQIILDLVYVDLAPTEENCPNIIEGIVDYMSNYIGSVHWTEVKRLLDTLLDRLAGKSIEYTLLCTVSENVSILKKAENILKDINDVKRYDVLRRIYGRIIHFMEAKQYDTKEEYCKELAILLDNYIECCFAYSSSPEYLAEAFVEVGDDTVKRMSINLLSKDYYFNDFKDRNVVWDQVLDNIVRAFEFATSYIAISELSAIKKGELYSKIQKFYSDKTLLFKYKNVHYSNIEKEYWYQERIEELGCLTNKYQYIEILDGKEKVVYSSTGITKKDLADKYVEKGEYNKAIEIYLMLYKSGDIVFASIAQTMVEIYEKMGNYKEAVKVLEEVLLTNSSTDNRELYYKIVQLSLTMKEPVLTSKYSKLLVEVCESEKFKKEPMSKEYLLNGYYSRYLISTCSEERKKYWKKCVDIFKTIKTDMLEKMIYSFIKEYMVSDSITYVEMNDILKRIDTSESDEFKIGLISSIIEMNKDTPSFLRWNVIYLLQLAELHLNRMQADYDLIRHYLTLANELIQKDNFHDEYIESLNYRLWERYMLRSEICIPELFDEIYQKCNYALLTEIEIKEGEYPVEQALNAWWHTADQYKIRDMQEMRIYCLEKAIRTLVPNFNLENSFEVDVKCEFFVRELTRAYKEIGDMNLARKGLELCYKHSVGDALDTPYDRAKKIKSFAIDCGLISDDLMIKKYIIALYMITASKIDEDIIISLDSPNEIDYLEMKTVIEDAILSGINESQKKLLIEICEDVLEFSTYSNFPQKYMQIIDFVLSNCKYEDFEFKK